jgi:hypothetical protein
MIEKAFVVLFLIALSLPAFTSDWAVRWDHANIRKEPSINSMLVYTLRKAQHAGLTDIGEKGDWVSVQFDAYSSWKIYEHLLVKGVKIKKLGSEGTVVQVTISGWTKKENLRKIL